MKNILLITPLYPIPYPENNATDVCHSFAKEWVKQGYNVVVAHFQPVHCMAWHFLIRLFGKQVANIVGGGNFYARRLRRTEHYVMDDVPVYRIPVYNIIPHGRFPAASIQKFVAALHSILDKLGFVPDVITGHMLPMEVIPLVNESYGAATCMVEHGIAKKITSRYSDYEEIISSYSCYGFRSQSIQEEFTRRICPVPNPFICYSGIPDNYLEGVPGRSFDEPLTRFLFVGELIKRKYPGVILEALHSLYPDGGVCLKYVGEGPEKSEIEKFASENSVSTSVVFTGKIPRDQIRVCYDESQMMIMVSKNEAFGLVYLEAMARGCIVVGARGEGIDGVIKDGENGFLCSAGDLDELRAVIRKVASLQAREREAISEAARSTARRMTDSSVAADYAKELSRWSK